MERVTIFGLEDWEKDYLAPLLKIPCEVFFCRNGLSPDTASKFRDSEAISVFVHDKVTPQVLEMMPGLKFIATRSTGFDHIDLAACRQRGITVSNVPSYGEATVAEHTFALILSLSRNIHKAYVRTAKGDFNLEGLMGFDLKGKTLGVIGAGHIGLHVVKMAKGFGMNVLVFDTRKDPFLEEIMMFRYAAFDELLGNSDIITLHVPYSEKTRHLINMGNIGRIKKGALLINTARGGLVEPDALTRALDEGILSGAGLDVLEGEELINEERELLSKDFPADKMKSLIRNHILMKRDDVVITPHIAFNSREAVQRILETTAENIIGYLEGKPRNTLP
ncbi:MAG: hydroxyacid dehydrogenase [Candidatus Omnitrophica bacterium]|nr:hydroxyacid dehydrogenase [Candidatus Omnitrophota bacterium]